MLCRAGRVPLYGSDPMPDHDTAGIAAPATRRRALTATLLAAVALHQGRPADARASCRKKARQSVSRTCARMRDECLAYYAERCADSSNPGACLADMTICCGH